MTAIRDLDVEVVEKYLVGYTEDVFFFPIFHVRKR
jgi:hypothetical protein